MQHGISLPIAASAQESHCDSNLSPLVGDPLGYRLRGDRCEGRYIKEMASTTLLIASLTSFFEDYDLSSGEDLMVKWVAPDDAGIWLRAQGLKRRLYYRMDTMRPPGSTSYTWSTNILAAMNIPRQALGIVGWTRYSVGETKRDVYVPLQIIQQGNPIRSHNYQVVVLPGCELKEVYISLAPVSMDGHPGVFLRSEEVLGYGYYPANHGIPISISDLEAAGVYYLEIGATLTGGGSSTIEIWFYHPGG